MRRIGRNLLTAVVVTLYGGIALLGYGLHELSPVHSHETEPGAVHSHSHSHAGCTHDHHHSHAPISDHAGYSDSHECDICYLLDQVRSESPQLVVIDQWQPLLADVAPTSNSPISEPPRGLHDPRGPPCETA